MVVCLFFLQKLSDQSKLKCWVDRIHIQDIIVLKQTWIPFLKEKGYSAKLICPPQLSMCFAFSIILMWDIDLKDLDLFLNSCQHSIINIAQKRNAILPSASSTQLSANKKIVFAITAAKAQSSKEQLDCSTLGCEQDCHLAQHIQFLPTYLSFKNVS